MQTLAQGLIAAAQYSMNGGWKYGVEPEAPTIKRIEQVSIDIQETLNAITGRMTINQIADATKCSTTSARKRVDMLLANGNLARGKLQTGSKEFTYWRIDLNE